MKKSIIFTLLFMFAAGYAYSMEPCKCLCGQRDMDFGDYLRMPAVVAGVVAGPALMNYMLYNDKNMTGLYIYDGILFSSAAIAIVSGDFFEGRIMQTARAISFISATVVVWGYSGISLVNGIFQKDGAKTGRGTIGIIAVPVVLAAAFLMVTDCRCKPENECLSFNPVISPEYAGLSYNVRF